MLVLRAFADHNPIYKDIKISHIEKSFFKKKHPVLHKFQNEIIKNGYKLAALVKNFRNKRLLIGACFLAR